MRLKATDGYEYREGYITTNSTTNHKEYSKKLKEFVSLLENYSDYIEAHIKIGRMSKNK